MLVAHLPPGSRMAALRALDQMKDHDVFTHPQRAALSYELLDYLRYEHSPVEDTIKKHLEMLTLTAAVDLPEIKCAIDIGTATCRYPRYLRRYGVNAYGVDVSPSGYQYIRMQKDRFDGFVQGDGLRLPFGDQTCDLVTCMMGTFNHILPHDRQRLLEEAMRVLRPDGRVALGIWDGECAYQSYLTMYSATERAEFRSRPATWRDTKDLLCRAGFGDPRCIRFMYAPDRFIHDLGIADTRLVDVVRILDIDLAVRERHPNVSGQMFLAVATTSVSKRMDGSTTGTRQEGAT